MSQGLRDLRWPLLLLVTFNLLPQLFLRPAWLNAFCFSLLLYRFWLESKQKSMPPRSFIWGATLLAGFLVWQQFQSFVGDEAGGAYLTLLICVKIFELERKRDYFFTTMLCVLVLMSYLLLEQGLLITTFLLGDVVLIISFLFVLEEEQWGAGGFSGALMPLKSTVSLALRASPLLILCFILFPRFSTGFSRSENLEAHTGVSDILRPGSVSKLIQSDGLVFRATFLHENVPPLSRLYWRGAVLDKSNGLDWDRSDNPFPRVQQSLVPADADIEVYIEPGSDRFLFSLSDNILLFPGETNRVIARDSTFELVEPLQNRDRYYLLRGTATKTSLVEAKRFLQTQAKPSREMLHFLRKFQGRSTEEAVLGLLDNFHQGGYSYSLQPKPSQSIDQFMFETKNGFCEHFAGSFATMLRDLKIPARVVVGFQGGTPSFLQNYITVRDHDAHAWVEYYDEVAQRWRTVDPTAQVAPLRISQGSDSYFANTRALMPTWMPEDWFQSYLRSRAMLDEVEAAWIRFLLHFDLARQKELLSKLGMEGVLFRALPVFLVLAFALCLALLYFFEAQRREKVSLDERYYRQLLRLLRRWKISKAPNEGPMTLLAKIEAVDANLGREVASILEPLVAARYGGQTLQAAVSRGIVARLRRLKKRR